MKDYRKKPVVIQAEQWLKLGQEIQEGPIISYGYRNNYSNCKYCDGYMWKHGWMHTLEGGHTVCPGDYIIKGVKGEFYPCKPDIFELTYEEVEI